MTEFNLSEKIIPYCWVEDIEELKKTNKADILYQDETILIEDVKEFIFLLKEKGKCKNPSQNGEIIYLLSEKEIDELAGEKLK